MRSLLGLTNGCFDLLHDGHVHLLREARQHCDILWVLLNSEESVRRLKGPGRPVQTTSERIKALRDTGYVDGVLVFDGDTPEHEIVSIWPDVLIKGSDYREEEIVGAQFVKSYGGKVVIVERLPGWSSSEIIASYREDTARVA